MQRTAKTVLLLAAAFCFSFDALAAALTPNEIQATFGTGKPFSSTTPSGTSYTIILNGDGTASRTPKKSSVAITGTWRLSKDGYCSKWGKSAENCYRIEKGTGRYNVLDKSGAKVAFWKIK